MGSERYALDALMVTTLLSVSNYATYEVTEKSFATVEDSIDYGPAGTGALTYLVPSVSVLSTGSESYATYATLASDISEESDAVTVYDGGIFMIAGSRPCLPLTHYGEFTEIQSFYEGPVSDLATVESWSQDTISNTEHRTTILVGESTETIYAIPISASWTSDVPSDAWSTATVVSGTTQRMEFFTETTVLPVGWNTFPIGEFPMTYSGDPRENDRSTVMALDQVMQTVTVTTGETIYTDGEEYTVTTGYSAWDRFATLETVLNQQLPETYSGGWLTVGEPMTRPAVALLGEGGNSLFSGVTLGETFANTANVLGYDAWMDVASVAPSIWAFVPHEIEGKQDQFYNEGYGFDVPLGTGGVDGISMSVSFPKKVSNSTGTASVPTWITFQNSYAGNPEAYSTTRPAMNEAFSLPTPVTYSGLWGFTTYDENGNSTETVYTTEEIAATVGVVGKTVVMSPDGLIAETAGFSGYF